jgi:hypothetical protein
MNNKAFDIKILGLQKGGNKYQSQKIYKPLMERLDLGPNTMSADV